MVKNTETKKKKSAKEDADLVEKPELVEEAFSAPVIPYVPRDKAWRVKNGIQEG